MINNFSLANLNIVRNNKYYYDQFNNLYNFLINNCFYTNEISLYIIDLIVYDINVLLTYNNYNNLLYDVYIKNIKKLKKYKCSIKPYNKHNFYLLLKKRMSYHLFEEINDNNIIYSKSIFEVLHSS